MEWLKTCANCKHFRKAWAWCAKKKQTREEDWDACDKQEKKEPFMPSMACKTMLNEIKKYNYKPIKR